MLDAHINAPKDASSGEHKPHFLVRIMPLRSATWGHCVGRLALNSPRDAELRLAIVGR